MEVDSRGRLVSILAEDNPVYPIDDLNRNRMKFFCKRYPEHHDERGREIRSGWAVYY